MANTNPTQTRGIEKRWRNEIRRRWTRFSRSIQAELARLNRQALDERGIVANTELGIDVSQARVYMAFVQQQIDDILLGAAESPNWQAQYQLESYQKSLEMFAAEIRRQGATEAATALELEVASTLSPFTATPSLGVQIGGNMPPVHRDAMEFLFTRSFESLENWTDQLANQVRQITVEAIATGESFEDTARAIRQRTEVSRSRANVIAQTEVNQAYGVAQTEQAKRTEETLGQPVRMRWLTVLDNRVRHLHAEWHGTLSSSEDARKRKNVSPWNCRCGLAPVVEGADTPAKQKKFAEERKRLLLAQGRAVPPTPKAKTPAKPKKPTKPKTKTALDRAMIRADQETAGFMSSSFQDDPAFWPIIERFGPPSALPRKPRQSAYYRSSKKAIHMRSYQAGTNNGDNTYRHEYGHYIDNILNPTDRKNDFFSSQKAWRDGMATGRKRVEDMDKAFFNANRASTSDRYSTKKSLDMFNDKMVAEMRKDMQAIMDDPVKWARANTKAGTPYRQLIDKLDESSVSNDDLRNAFGALVVSEKNDFPLGAIHAIWRKGGNSALRNNYDEAGLGADLVGALTDARWGGGHTKGYYTEKFSILDAETKRFVTVKESANTEAFANVFALENSASGELGKWLTRTFAPELVEILEGVL